MKTTTYFIYIRLFFLLLTAALFVPNQGNAQDSNDLIGSWIFSDGPSFARIEPDIKVHMDSIPQLKTEVFSAFTGRILTFSANGDFLMTLANGLQLPGTWTLTGNVLRVTSAEGFVMEQTVGELKTNRLTLIAPASAESRPVLPEMFYRKI